MPPKPHILSFDTSGPYCAACLAVGNEIIETQIEEMPKGQAEELMPICEALLEKHQLTWRDLAAIGVITGPGNFTGLRIAVSAARGLGLALEIPVVGVSRFEALAWGTEGNVNIVLQARKGYLYTQEFSDSATLAAPCMVPEAEVVDPLTDINISQLIENTGKIVASNLGQEFPPPAPLYISPPDAAPAKPTGITLLS